MSYIWRNRAAPAGDEAGVSDEASDAAVSHRLRRVVGRVERIDPAPASEGGQPGCFAGAELTRNAFALLGVGIEDRAAAINDAVDALSFEPGSDPDALGAARARLMSARDRLAEELGWLPELSPDLLASVRAALAAGDVAAIAAARDATIGLARINLSLALVAALPEEADRAARAVTDSQSLDGEDALARLNEARERSGFRPIDRDSLETALLARARATARMLASAFAASTSARNLLTRTLQAGSPAIGGFGGTFVDELLRVYGGEIDAALEQAKSRVMAAVEALRANPSDLKQANALAASLDLWSNLRRPIQVHEAARGLDDPASAELFDSVRSLSIDLANDHEEYEIALRLARTLIASFALVPFHRAALERELPVLIGNNLIRRLSQLCEAAKRDVASFVRSVSAGGLVRGGGPAGQVAAAFADACEATPDKRASYFLIVRDLAVHLHNLHQEDRAARAITAWLAAQDPPAEVRERLDQDLATLGIEPPPMAAGGEAGDAAPVRFGRAAGRPAATGKAPPPPARSGTAPPYPKAAEAAAQRVKLTTGQWLFLLFCGIVLLTLKIDRVTRRHADPAPASTTPRLVISDAPEEGPNSLQQRLREMQARAANDRIRQADSAPPIDMPAPTSLPAPGPSPTASSSAPEAQAPSTGTSAAAMPTRALGTRPVPSVSAAPPPLRPSAAQGGGFQ